MKALALLLIAALACGCGPETAGAALEGCGKGDPKPPDAGSKADAGTATPPDAGTATPPDAVNPADAGSSSGQDAGPALVNASQYVSQSVPGSVSAGAKFEVKVTMRNSGTTSWSYADSRGHFLGSEGPKDNSTWGTNRIFIPAGVIVPPGASHTFVHQATAPATAGSYSMQWQMLQDAVEWFGATTPLTPITVVKVGPPPGSTPLQIVQFNRSQYGSTMTPTDLITCLRSIARDLNAENIPGGPFGVLVKPSGNNCDGYSCDIICSGQNQQQRQWDVLVDTGGASSPTWHEVSGITIRPCELL